MRNGMGVLILGLLAASSRVAVAAPPAWCKDFEGNRLSHSFDKMKLAEDPVDSMQAIVVGMCDERQADHFEEAKAAHKEFSAKLDMNDDDWAAGVTYWSMVSRGDDINTRSKQKGTWALGAMDQWLVLRNTNTTKYQHDVADSMGELSALGRLGFARWCASTNQRSEVHLAACLPDVEAVDLKAISTELRADKTHEPWMRFLARMDYVRVLAGQAEIKKRAAELKEKDQAFGKMFEIAAKAHKDWRAAAAKRQPLLTLVGEMENAAATQSRKASDGCQAKTLEALQTAVRGIPASKFAGVVIAPATPIARQVVRPILDDPDAYLAARAYIACANALAAKEDFLASELMFAAETTTGYRGPHTAAITSIAISGLQLDERGATLTFPSGDSPGSRLGVQAVCAVAPVQTVKPGDKLQTLTFSDTKYKYIECSDMEEGTKITAVRWDGTVERASTCHAYKEVTGTRKHDPVEVDARFTSAIKPGMSVAACNQVVLVGWAKGAKVPSVILGAAVK